MSKSANALLFSDKPSRQEIESQVDGVINAVLKRFKKPQRATPIDDALKLEKDLGFDIQIRRALSVPFSKIAKQYPNGTKMGPSETGACETVGNCVDLTWKHAKGQL